VTQEEKGAIDRQLEGAKAEAESAHLEKAEALSRVSELESDKSKSEDLQLQLESRHGELRTRLEECESEIKSMATEKEAASPGRRSSICWALIASSLAAKSPSVDPGSSFVRLYISLRHQCLGFHLHLDFSSAQE
jgi:chromosome segregation ATPase